MAVQIDGASNKFILDTDADTYLEGATDDTIKVYVSGAEDLRIGANAINVLSGTTLTIDSGATIANSGTATGFGAVTALNNATANELVTVGGTTTELDAEANLTFTGSALTCIGTITVGVDDTGHDVKFFGATSGAYMLWDESTDDLVLAGAANLYLYDAAGGEKLSSNGTDLTINSGNDINLTATTDINIPSDVGLTFGDDGEKIEGDGSDLTISGNTVNLDSSMNHTFSSTGKAMVLGL